MVHTTCLVEYPLSPHVNMFLRRTCGATWRLEVGWGHMLEK